VSPPPHPPPENEARAFAKSEGWETEDVEEIALRVGGCLGDCLPAWLGVQRRAGLVGLGRALIQGCSTALACAVRHGAQSAGLNSGTLASHPHPSSACPAAPPLLQIARFGKASGVRPRTVVITQGADPTVVALQGRLLKFPVSPAQHSAEQGQPSTASHS
jgi:hypothetical protein